MPFISVYIHFVWRTKNGFPFLNSSSLRQVVWQHIKENAALKGVFVDYVSGYSDHCHCLVSLTHDQTISKTMQLIKGESSFWINKNNLCNSKFDWQDEYYAVSVSKSILKNVREYIVNQEEHHKKKTFNEEVDEFVSKYGFVKLYDLDSD